MLPALRAENETTKSRCLCHLSRDTSLCDVTGHQLLRARPSASKRPGPSSLPCLTAPARGRGSTFTTGAAAPLRPDAWPCTTPGPTLPWRGRVKRRRAVQACNRTEGYAGRGCTDGASLAGARPRWWPGAALHPPSGTGAMRWKTETAPRAVGAPPSRGLSLTPSPAPAAGSYGHAR